MAITYIEKGLGLHRAIAAAGYSLLCVDGQWIASNDAAVQAIIDSYDALPDLRAAAHESVRLERERRQALGLSYAFPDGQGTIQTRNEQDLLNVTGQVTAALVLQAQGVGAPVMQFRDEQNVTHAMTPEQMVAMGMAVSAFVSATYAAKWTHDEAIDAWDGIGEYDHSTGWPEE